jgi:tRNA(fMet)-specific endonuclease VapC
MTLYVLDTDTLTLFQEGHATVCGHCAAHTAQELAITIITVEEQLTGWYTVLRRPHPPARLAYFYQRWTQNVQFLSRLQILSYTEPAILRYEQLLALKLNIGKMDLRIAAITQEHSGILVTRNVRDFQRVPGLAIEDWTV